MSMDTGAHRDVAPGDARPDPSGRPGGHAPAPRRPAGRHPLDSGPTGPAVARFSHETEPRADADALGLGTADDRHHTARQEPPHASPIVDPHGVDPHGADPFADAPFDGEPAPDAPPGAARSTQHRRFPPTARFVEARRAARAHETDDDPAEEPAPTSTFRDIRPQRRIRLVVLVPLVTLATLGSLMFAFPLAFSPNGDGAPAGILGLLLMAAAACWATVVGHRAGSRLPGLPHSLAGQRPDWRIVLAYAAGVGVLAALALWRVAVLV
ncbi:hypothetical protein [Allostreptomyces psammosilenae]|uniref:Transmembrane protein n=1 Tax=Allostreptomyces psammosilenae TaxID=1892865 RepID=A0A852ZL06_9ACTN|nr:hypothetical protein [Allostreptomyces psammosilenae]NYI03089.1 hypothetical protein [Allostreptomyces psammosilenae]